MTEELELAFEGNGKPSNTSTLLDRVQEGKVSPDDFQTPPWVAGVILPYLPPGIIWESAAGKGNLVRAFQAAGRDVVGSDILTGQDFFSYEPARWDVQVTNVPFSLKDRWLARSYALGKPFALLLPLAALGEQARMRMYRERGISVVMPDRRINYQAPSGKGTGAWLFTCWFCHGHNLPSQIVFWSAATAQPTLAVLDSDEHGPPHFTCASCGGEFPAELGRRAEGHPCCYTCAGCAEPRLRLAL